jgi:two-component system cell cycle response regulator DivK
MDMGRSAYRTKEENPVSILKRDFYHSDGPTNRGANQGNTNRNRILIVEDHDLSVMLLNDFLEVHGYEILKTGHGLEAIKLARDNKPDLILMDIQLPDLSGLDVTRVLKQDDQTKYIPVIAVTAFAMSGDKAKALGSGCDAYISKPVILHNLLRMVDSFLSPFSRIGGQILLIEL